MLFNELGYEDIGQKIVDSIERVIVNKEHLPTDMGGNASTSEVGDAVLKEFSARYE